MPAFVPADDPQTVGQQRDNLIPEPQIGSQGIGKYQWRTCRIAVVAIVKLHVSQIGDLQ